MSFGSATLTSIYIDGVPLADFSPLRHDYHVELPYGRPRIPRIHAEAEIGAVTVTQATFAPTARDAVALIELDEDGVRSEYRVVFTKSKALGFVLQFDDRYQYRPAVHMDPEHPITYVSSRSLETLSPDRP